MLAVSRGPHHVPIHTALYELEFREVLALYLDTRRQERAEEAQRLEQAALMAQAFAAVAGWKPDQVEQLGQGLHDAAARLREPELALPEEEMLTEAQQAFFGAGRRARQRGG